MATETLQKQLKKFPSGKEGKYLVCTLSQDERYVHLPIAGEHTGDEHERLSTHPTNSMSPAHVFPDCHHTNTHTHTHMPLGEAAVFRWRSLARTRSSSPRFERSTFDRVCCVPSTVPLGSSVPRY